MTTPVTVSRALLPLLDGEVRTGRVVGSQHIDFDGYVVVATPPGVKLLPNGIGVRLPVGETTASIGGGKLVVGDLVAVAGQVWEPVPAVPQAPVRQPCPPEPVMRLLGAGPGLTPAGDDVIAGYLAGLCLLHHRNREAGELAARATGQTTHLSETLIEHAAHGELPEAAHSFVARGDASALLRFGHSSGRHLLLGLVLAGARPPDGSAATVPSWDC